MQNVQAGILELSGVHMSIGADVGQEVGVAGVHKAHKPEVVVRKEEGSNFSAQRPACLRHGEKLLGRR